ncbi:MAG: hypothetical protein ACJA0A_000195 [Acidimicrobiales bacterium]|jgi:hypothetical protein
MAGSRTVAEQTVEMADDEARLAGLALRLADGIVVALPGWVERCVTTRSEGVVIDDGAVADAGRLAAHEVGPLVRGLLSADIDEQRTGPLALVRAAVKYPASVLSAAGVVPVQRDADALRLFPDDAYDLSPASFAELHPDLRVPGLEWGAAKAYVHRRRHAGGTAG